MVDLVGKTLGRYHIVDQLGEGGMASVYRAFDTRLDRYVALKVIGATMQDSDNFLKRFEREAKALAQLSHPNIVKVYDYGEEGGLPYLVMEYLPGGTLKQKMSGLPMPYAQAARLVAPIAHALAYAHKINIIHRDVKPANILFSDSNTPMLSDFGIAKMLEVKNTVELTGTGVGIGTPEYVAPEQGMGYGADQRSDIYSLGVVFYELVTGRKPFRADTPMAIVLKHITEPLPRPREFVGDLPAEVEQVLFKALAKKPEDRYQDMDAFAKALEKLFLNAETAQNLSPAIGEDATVLKTPIRAAEMTPSAIAQPMVKNPVVPSTPVLGVPNTHVDSPVKPIYQSFSSQSTQAVPRTPSQPWQVEGPVAQLVKKKSMTWLWIIGGVVLVGGCLIVAILGGWFVINTSGSPSATNTQVVAQVEDTPIPIENSPEAVTQVVGGIDGFRVGNGDEAQNADQSGNVKSLSFYTMEEYGPADYLQVDKPLSFTVRLESPEPLLWFNSWCAVDQQTLDENLKQMSFGFEANGIAVSQDKIVSYTDSRSDGSPCQGYYVLLTDWKPGEYFLNEIIAISNPINDGWDQFASGKLVRSYSIIVKSTDEVQKLLADCAGQVDRTSLLTYSVGNPIYCRQFNDYTDATTGFDSGGYGELTSYISDGKYNWYINSLQGVVYFRAILLDPIPGGTFGFTIDGNRFSGTEQSDYGIIFHYNTNNSDCYYFSIADASQMYSIYIHQNNQWTTLQANTYSDAIVNSGDNQIAVLASGSQYTVVINGKNIYSFTDSTLTGGTVGVAASVYPANETLQLSFDNYLLVGQ